MKTIENGKCQRESIVCVSSQDNLNTLWLLLHRFQKFAISIKRIRLHDNDIIIIIYRLQIFPHWRLFPKVIVFSENDHRF